MLPYIYSHHAVSGPPLSLFSHLYWVDQWRRYLRPTLLFQPWSQFLGGFPGGTSSKESAWQCRRCKRHGFNPWVGKIHLAQKATTTPAFLPGESHGQGSLVGCRPRGHESQTWLSGSTPGSSPLIPPTSPCTLPSFSVLPLVSLPSTILSAGKISQNRELMLWLFWICTQWARFLQQLFSSLSRMPRNWLGWRLRPQYFTHSCTSSSDDV